MAVDIEAISGICGSISIACWVVVYSPQIVENFRRSSAEGLSTVFIVIWTIGDIFNAVGGVLQGVLPTMIILAFYYTLADIVLITQCFYYSHINRTKSAASETGENTLDQHSSLEHAPNERTSLLPSDAETTSDNRGESTAAATESHLVRHESFRDHIQTLDATRLSPAMPMHQGRRDEAALKAQSPIQTRRPLLYAVLFNFTAVLVVFAAGLLGWWLSTVRSSTHRHGLNPPSDTVPSPPGHNHTGSSNRAEFDILGQVFGYLCAVFYLGSRIPQLLLNYQRKSTDGVAMLFFIFACLGNLTYVMSILAFEPKCDHYTDGKVVFDASFCDRDEAYELYLHNVLINLSWLIGSLGTLLLDFVVFFQFFRYRVLPSDSEATAIADE